MLWGFLLTFQKGFTQEDSRALKEFFCFKFPPIC